jgi:hypothetical protein
MEQAVANGGTINHALRMTLQNGYMHNAFLWPATTSANAGTGVNFYGERVRLKSGFDVSTFSPVAKILLTQLKQYGLIFADGGTGWSVDAEYTKWPKTYADAFWEIRNAGLTAANFEVVDESGLMISSTSGETTNNRETVTFTRNSDSATASVDVVLTGVTVNLPNDVLYIQAGAPAQQFTAFSNIGTVNWSMSPSIGTLTTNGLYIPPATIGSTTITTVTATSTVNPAIAASMIVTVFPTGVIRLVPGSLPGTLFYQMVPTSYTDSNGNVWSSTGDDGGYANDGGVITGTADPTLYRYEYAAYSGGDNDQRYDLIVPNGSYQITYKAASTFGVAGTQVQKLEVNGSIVYDNLDLYVVSGGHNKAWDFVTPVTVTNNRLSFVLRLVNNAGTHIGALQIAPQ